MIGKELCLACWHPL